MRCHGWDGDCGYPVERVVRWSYDGARKFPSAYTLCDDCAGRCVDWVRKLELELGTDCELTTEWVMEGT